jgi:hypothetical protein
MPSKSQSILLGAAAYIGASIVLQVVFRGLGAAPAIAGGVVGCLVMLAVGAVPVWHYTRTNALSVPAGTGAGLGAASIALGAAVMAIITFILVETGVAPNPQEVAEEIAEQQGLSGQEAEIAMLMAHPLLSGLFGVVMGAIVGAIGGAIGASVFRRNAGGADAGHDRRDL